MQSLVKVAVGIGITLPWQTVHFSTSIAKDDWERKNMATDIINMATENLIFITLSPILLP